MNVNAAEPLDALLSRVRACQLCAAHLPLGPRPVLQAHASARILIASQAPGRKVHASGIPFDDASGERLRAWMGVSRETFYDPRQVAILPMGFCYPGRGASGDLPPRPECAPAWRQQLLDHLPRVRLTLAIGHYALAWHLPEGYSRSGAGGALTDTVHQWPRHGSDLFPLPHPSPRNNGWLQRNPWFEAELLPPLRLHVAAALTGTKGTP